MKNSPERISGNADSKTLGVVVLASIGLVALFAKREVSKVMAPDEETRPSAVARFMGKYIPLLNDLNAAQDARVDHVESGRIPPPEGAEETFSDLQERALAALDEPEPDPEKLSSILDELLAFLEHLAEHNNPTALTARTYWLASQLSYQSENLDDAIAHAREATKLAKLNVSHDETSTLKDELKAWSEKIQALAVERSQKNMEDWQADAGQWQEQFDTFAERMQQEREDRGIY